MPKMDSTGVYQLKNGNWGYRFCVSVNGKSISKRCSRDAFGRILRTKKEAIQARMQDIVAEHTETPVIEVAKAELAPRTVKEVFLDTAKRVAQIGHTTPSRSRIRCGRIICVTNSVIASLTISLLVKCRTIWRTFTMKKAMHIGM